MSAPERIWAWWEHDSDFRITHRWEDEARSFSDDEYDGAEYIHHGTAAETIRQAVLAEREACAIAAGDAAVDALMRQDPEAGPLRRQLVRTKAISAIRARGDA